jgi:fructose-specific component phosphotransferase system IIB-like protein
MGEAEVAAAQKFAWEVVGIADDEDRQAAQAGNAIKARQWLAGKLHEKYGAAPVAQQAPVNITNMVTLSDEQLLAIAGSAIDGEYALVGKDVVAESVGEEEGDVEVVGSDTVGEGDGRVVLQESGLLDGSDEVGEGWGFLNEENA